MTIYNTDLRNTNPTSYSCCRSSDFRTYNIVMLRHISGACANRFLVKKA